MKKELEAARAEKKEFERETNEELERLRDKLEDYEKERKEFQERLDQKDLEEVGRIKAQADQIKELNLQN